MLWHSWQIRDFQEICGEGIQHIYYLIKKEDRHSWKNIQNNKYPKKLLITPKTNKTDRVNTIYKTKSNPRTKLPNKSFDIEKYSEINIEKDNRYVSDLFMQGESLASVTPYQQRNPRKK